MDLGLEGRIAIVTGGSQGIGRAIADVLVEEGAVVAICARRREPLEAAAAEINAAGGRAFPVVADVGDTVSVDAMVEQVVAEFGRVDVLVNNAGVPGGLANGPIATVTDEKMWEDLNVKYMGVVRCSRAVAPHMKRQGWGRIVNIAGQNGRLPSGYSGGARNVAIAHTSRSLAEELGRDGITVNVVHPGLTRSPLINTRIADQAKREGIDEAEAERRMAQQRAIKRMVEAREIGYAVAFLASEQAGAITGGVIDASGGSVQAVFI